MKRLAIYFILFLIGVSFLISIPACGKKEKNQNELAVGNWTQFRNRAYILLITNPKGEWNSSVRIADVTSKIVKSKGHAKGTWYIENNQMIFTVSESEIEEIWEKNATTFFDIVELTDTIMQLKDEFGRSVVWKHTNVKKAATSDDDLSPIVSVGPVAVNLNKNRSNDKDRYLCLNMNLVLKELMPDQEIPPIHPKAREAGIIFLSSLVFNDVKDFDRIKKQIRKLVDVLNPYMEGFIKEIAVEHVIIATEIDKVEEFIIEHTLIEEPAPEQEEEGEKSK
ncbi:MAG: flagellar basal body-associated protein FliL [Desulfobacula sp.]|uniref:flagellar basal body-associated protein FliL n=1 Tax=Desulfobacula sp. TaxID=2593537 RepID=UPI0025BB9C02|nr:flagellar basal body-associated protein FliL [Desulfobacula sp.]MCD4722462.1 flagellar basal body-associated protein FliL [Desulfobacula sp.]